MSADQTHCARCAGLGRTCCQDTHIFLSRGDVARLEEAVPGEDFWEYSAPADPESMPEAETDPVWARTFDSEGRRRAIRHRAGGDCHFLEPGGCRLPAGARPYVCRLYPFDYDHERIRGVYANLCHGPESSNPAFILAALGMNRTEAEEWRRELYREIAEEFPE